jgi:hypothetical protein
LSWKTERFGSPHHQRVEKPCQTLRERPSLKEKTIAARTGISDQAM